MSVVTVEQAKTYLLVIGSSQDARLQQLIDEAEDECRQYLDRDVLPRIGAECPDDCDTAAVDDPVSDGEDLAPALRRGILMIVQAGFEAKDADEMMKMRKAAETCWAPFRCRWGA